MFKSSIPKEVKEEILGKVKSGESVAKLASDYGISNRTIYGWLGKKALSGVSLVQYNKLKQENSQLKEIVGILTFELEKLKKRRTRNLIKFRLIPKFNKSFLSKLFNIPRISLYRLAKVLKRFNA